MKKLPNSTVINVLAHLALHERIQEMFNIYPGQLVKDIKSFAMKVDKDPRVLLNELRDLVSLEFDFVLANVARELSGRNTNHGVGNRLYAREIRQRFQLDPHKMVRDYPKKAKDVGLDVESIIQAIRELVPVVIRWAFDEVSTILDKEGVR